MFRSISIRIRPRIPVRRRCFRNGRSKVGGPRCWSVWKHPNLVRESRPKLPGAFAKIAGQGIPKNVQFNRCDFDPSLNGKTLADATALRGHAGDD